MRFIIQKNKYPWMVALVGSSGGQFCGGTLVASKYVISAAHCMFADQQETIPLTASDFKVLRIKYEIFL